MVDRWAGDSLTRKPNLGPFAVSWPRQLDELLLCTVITIADRFDRGHFGEALLVYCCF